MQMRYEPRFEALSADQTMYLGDAILRRTKPDAISLESISSGTELFEQVHRAGLDHADVVMSLAHDPSQPAVEILETLIGQPITRKATAPPKEKGNAKRRSPGPRTSASRSDPRVITNIQPNPKKPGSASHARFALYRDGMTVAEFCAAGGSPADVKWDAERSYITLEDSK